MAIKSEKGKASLKAATERLAASRAAKTGTTTATTTRQTKPVTTSTGTGKKNQTSFQGGSVRQADGTYVAAMGGKENVGKASTSARRITPAVNVANIPSPSIGRTAQTTPDGINPVPLQPGVEQFVNQNNPSKTGTFSGPNKPGFGFATTPKAPVATTGSSVTAPAPTAAGLTRDQEIANIAAEGQKIQEQFNKLKEQEKSNLDAAISTDEPVVNEEESALDLISYDSPTKDALDLLEREIERQEGLFREDKRAIEADYRSQQTSQEKKQAGEMGQTSVGLANAGGYLGFSGSGTGVMLSLAKGHRDELLALEAERQNAIREARAASENRRFDLVREYASEIARVDQEVYQRKQDYFNNKLKLQQQEISREEKMKLESDIFTQIQAGKTTVTDIYEALGGNATVEEINDALTGFIPKSTEGGFEFSASNTAKLIGSGMGREDIVALNEILNEEGYTDAVRAALTPTQRYVLDDILKDTETGTGTTTGLGKPLSILDIGRIEETYGVTFPYGITQAEVTKFFEETAGMTPEEQQAVIDGELGTDSSITFSKDYLINNLSVDELKTLADKTGASRFFGKGIFSGTQEDIERMFDTPEYMNKLNQMVEEAKKTINDDTGEYYKDEEILEYLTK